MKKGLGIALVVICLSACGQSPIKITRNDALAISLDAVGYRKEDVSNIDVDQNDCYYVSFVKGEKDYTFRINENGIIEERKIEQQEIVEEVVEEVVEESLEEVVEETIVVENENTNQEMKEVALQSALSKLELTMEDVQDTSVSDEPDGSYTVRFWVNELGKGVSVSTDSQGQYVSLREG